MAKVNQMQIRCNVQEKNVMLVVILSNQRRQSALNSENHPQWEVKIEQLFPWLFALLSSVGAEREFLENPEVTADLQVMDRCGSDLKSFQVNCNEEKQTRRNTEEPLCDFML